MLQDNKSGLIHIYSSIIKLEAVGFYHVKQLSSIKHNG